MKALSPVGKFHTISNQRVSSSLGSVVPVLYFKRRDGTIFIHEQFHEYMLANQNTSKTWKLLRARALGLFWDFCQSFEMSDLATRQTDLHRAIFRQFCQSLLFGTIDVETKLDKYELFWPSTNKKLVRLLVSGLQDFITWVYNENIGTTSTFTLSSFRKLSDQEKHTFPQDSVTSTRFLIIAHKLKKISFFSHLNDAPSKAKQLQRNAERQIYNFGSSPGQLDDSAIYMSPEIVAAMLQYGFVRDPKSNIPHVREDLTAKMLFLLLCFGGCRYSEPFHLWYNDVAVDDKNRCKVTLRHPGDAGTYLIGETGTRREYLARIGLLPRNDDGRTKSYKAGWKSLSVDKSYNAPVFWLHDGADALFASLYNIYLRYRSNLMEQRLQRNLPEHPFLFVSSGEDRHANISKIGDPYSMRAFSKAWDRALKRVSEALERPIIKKKEYGTTEHAPRHFYGQALADSSTNPKMIQKALRHRTILSQATYTAPDYAKINSELQTARQNIRSGHSRLDFSKINSALAIQ